MGTKSLFPKFFYLNDYTFPSIPSFGRSLLFAGLRRRREERARCGGEKGGEEGKNLKTK